MQFRLSQDKGFLLEKSEWATPHVCVGIRMVRMYMKTCQMAKLRPCQHGMKVYVLYRLEDPMAEAIHCAHRMHTDQARIHVPDNSAVKTARHLVYLDHATDI